MQNPPKCLCITLQSFASHIYERRFQSGVTRRMLRDNIEMVPSLASATVGDGWVGLRPCRQRGVRLELEMRGSSGVVHNYGHGGAGLCLSYGCAEEVVGLVRACLAKHKVASPRL